MLPLIRHDQMDQWKAMTLHPETQNISICSITIIDKVSATEFSVLPFFMYLF